MHRKQYLGPDLPFERVKDRLALFDRLSLLKDFFNDKKLSNEAWQGIKGNFSSVYGHFQSLRHYLLLTCFDILGQNSEYLQFDAWINSKKFAEERKSVSESLGNQDVFKDALSIYNYYLRTYGVKNSFNNFIRNVLDDQARLRLMNSIRVQKMIIKVVDGCTNMYAKPKQEQTIDTVDEKEKFLYQIRNYFTHNGHLISSSWPPFVKGFDEGVLIDGETKFFWNHLYIEKRGDEYVTYETLNWPSVLREILEATIKRLEAAQQ